MHRFYDQYLHEATDLREYNDYLYVSSRDQIRKYNRFNGEYVKTFATVADSAFVSMYFHLSYAKRIGE